MRKFFCISYRIVLEIFPALAVAPVGAGFFLCYLLVHPISSPRFCLYAKLKFFVFHFEISFPKKISSNDTCSASAIFLAVITFGVLDPISYCDIVSWLNPTISANSCCVNPNSSLHTFTCFTIITSVDLIIFQNEMFVNINITK